MATLRGPERALLLPERCLVGRSRSCDLVLSAGDVSGEHAVVQWSADHWELRELGSRNGSFVDGTRVAAGERAPLQVGMRLRFGRLAAVWTLEDVSPPQLMATALAGGECRVAEGGYLALPAESPTLAVYQAATGEWVMEQDGATRPVADRDVLEAGGLWRVHLPSALGGTWEAAVDLAIVARLRLSFRYSRDEEQVELVAYCGERRIDLQVRVHHYPLLLLARRRLADIAAGVPAAEQGFMKQDELLAMLRLKEDHLGIYIHRARAQLGKAGVVDAAALVERRSGTGMLRIGVAALELSSLP
jgi:hypothetical protein